MEVCSLSIKSFLFGKRRLVLFIVGKRCFTYCDLLTVIELIGKKCMRGICKDHWFCLDNYCSWQGRKGGSDNSFAVRPLESKFVARSDPSRLLLFGTDR